VTGLAVRREACRRVIGFPRLPVILHVARRAIEARRLEPGVAVARVAREQARLTRQAARKDPNSVVIYDVPLLFEAGIDKRVDTTVVVTADRETQIARLKKRNGLMRAEALRRIRGQMPLSLKRHRADYVLDGTKQPRRLASDVTQLFKSF